MPGATGREGPSGERRESWAFSDTRIAEAETPEIDLDRVWAGVRAEVWNRPIRWSERWAARILGSAGLARALVATPSLVLSWIVASVAVLAVGIVATERTGTPWVALLAPALAGIGIAYAYGPGVDPAYELSQTMAVPDRLVLLTRGLAVYGLKADLALLASLVVGTAFGLVIGWLLPMAAVSTVALAVTTICRSANTGVAAALAAWAVIVLGQAYDRRELAAAVEVNAAAPLYLAVTVGCLALALVATDPARGGETAWR